MFLALDAPGLLAYTHHTGPFADEATVAERPIPSSRLILVDLPYLRTARAAWPVLVARARRSGANAVLLCPELSLLAQVPPYQKLDDLRWLIQLCGQAGLAVVVECPSAEPLEEEQRRMLEQGLRPLIHPSGPILALLENRLAEAAHLPMESSVGRTLTTLEQLSPLYLPGGLGRFRADGSATAQAWPDRILLMLVSSALLSTLTAHPVTARAPDEPAAWADASDVNIAVRHGREQSIILVDNRRSEPYIGMLTYRDRGGELLHLQVNIGPYRSGCVLLDGEEISGVAVSGDASEATWVVRAMQTSVLFSGGAGGLVPCGDGALLFASQSGRFQLRRPQGWDGLCAMRLTQYGALLDASVQPDGTHLTIPYIAEDTAGQTDLYALVPASGQLPESFGRYLSALCAARAATMGAVAEDAGDSTYTAAAERLAEAARAAHTALTYRDAWHAADNATAAFLSTLPAPSSAHNPGLLAGLLALEEWRVTR
jgi:hypothetical protein